MQEPQLRQEIYNKLTQGEINILKHLDHKNTNPMIAELLGISEPTVKTHLNNIFRKLRLRNRAEAAVLAHKAGLTQTE